MADYLGRYHSPRDRRFFDSINAELMGDIIQTLVVLYKIAPNETITNMYGETSQATGKFYFPGIEMTSIVDRGYNHGR